MTNEIIASLQGQQRCPIRESITAQEPDCGSPHSYETADGIHPPCMTRRPWKPRNSACCVQLGRIGFSPLAALAACAILNLVPLIVRPLSLSLSLSLYICIYIHPCMHAYVHYKSISLSLSLFSNHQPPSCTRLPAQLRFCEIATLPATAWEGKEHFLLSSQCQHLKSEAVEVFGLVDVPGDRNSSE